MRISAAFPSDYLKAADLQGQHVRVVMSHVEMRDVGDDHKPVLFFVGKDRGLVLNKTNSNNISAIYGDESEDWRDKEIILYETMVDFQGKSVPAVRVRAPNARDKANGSSGKRATPTQPPRDTRENDQQRHDHETRGDDLSDPIPF